MAYKSGFRQIYSWFRLGGIEVPSKGVLSVMRLQLPAKECQLESLGCSLGSCSYTVGDEVIRSHLTGVL